MKTGCKLAVVGSRTFTDFSFLCEKLDKHQPCRIISGGARGADSLSADYAIRCKLPMTEHRADWAFHGRKAGMIRNHFIVEDCEELVAFWDGQSKGTAHSIELARSASKPLYIYWPEEGKEPQSGGLK